MERIKLNSTIIGLGLFSTYHGYGDTEWTLNESIIEEDFKERSSDMSTNYYYMYFDNKKYMEIWNEKVFDYIQNTILQDIFNILDVEFSVINLGHWSPKEYNFDVDSCNFELELDWDLFSNKVFDYVNTNKEEFINYLKDNYTSYDGFMSFTANNFENWLENFNNKRVQEIAAALSFIINKEYTKEQIREDAVYNVFGDMYYSEFVDYTELDKFLKNINEDTDIDWQLDIINRNKELVNE